jgi:hypothetical protein
LVQLRNRGCELRTCPVYGLSVFADGSVLYIGGANVAVLGERRLKVPNTTVVAVIDALDHLDFLDLPEECCECIDGRSNAWASKVVLDYRPGAVQKEVVVDDGCPGQSNGSAVMDLFQQIERLVGGVESMISTTRASDSP